MERPALFLIVWCRVASLIGLGLIRVERCARNTEYAGQSETGLIVTSRVVDERVRNGSFTVFQIRSRSAGI